MNDMGRRYVYICGLLFVVVVVILVSNTTTITTTLTTTPTSAETLLEKAKPLVWLSDTTLLVGLDDKIVKYDTVARKVVGVVSEPYYSSDVYECFSLEGGVFPVTKPVVTLTDGGKDTYYGDMVYRWIKDWNAPHIFTEPDNVQGWNTNPHDCSHFEFVEESYSKEIAGRAFGRESGPRLLREESVVAKIYFSYDAVNGEYERVALVDKQGVVKTLNLGSAGFMEASTDSSFDRVSNKYFWYSTTSSFTNSDGVWPLQGWWVSPDAEILNEVVIPKGPWVTDPSFLKRLAYFSGAGLSTYSRMKMYASAGNIYIRIWGKAVDDSARGIYKLDTQKQQWEKLVAGALDMNSDLALSPETNEPISILTGFFTSGSLYRRGTIEPISVISPTNSCPMIRIVFFSRARESCT